jgi:hypothetical protein
MPDIIISYPNTSSVLRQSRYLIVSHINGTNWKERERGILLCFHRSPFNNQDSLRIKPRGKLLLLEWTQAEKGLASILESQQMAVCMPEPGFIHSKPDIIIRHGRIFNPHTVYDIFCEAAPQFQKVKAINVWQKIGVIWEIMVNPTDDPKGLEKIRHIIKLVKEKKNK